MHRSISLVAPVREYSPHRGSIKLRALPQAKLLLSGMTPQILKTSFRFLSLPTLLLFCIVVQVNASPTTWNLSNVKFSDGSSVTGYFVLDADVAIPQTGLTNYQIVVSGGSILPSFTYTPADPLSQLLVYSYTNASGQAVEVVNPFRRNPLAYELLYLDPVSFLTSTGGVVPLDLVNSTGQLSNGETTIATATLISGSLTGAPTTVPEPANFPLFLFGALVAASSRRLLQMMKW